MLRCPSSLAAGFAAAAIFSGASLAQAQWFGGGSNGCDCGAATYSPCAVMQPIVQPCYQTVAVTEYEPVKQIVRRPKVEQKLVSQDVVEYHPITEQRVADVPTTTYQDVTEYRQVCRNAGYWQTQCQQNCKIRPCDYDNRPGLLGWMNRTGMEVRNAFTPTHTVSRQFIPQQVVQNVPITRRVAVQGTRQVTYNVTRMEARRSTRQVAVNHVTYEDVETTAMRPRTVMRQVPIGTSTVYAPLGTSTAFGPIPDATVNRPLENRSAINRSRDNFTPEADPNNFKDQPIKAKGASIERPLQRKIATPPGSDPVTKAADERPLVQRSTPPSMVRLNTWVARTPRPDGPTSDMSLADVNR